MSYSSHRLWIPAVALCLAALCLPGRAASLGFSAQARVGLRLGDQWEPAIAADGYGHVYILYPQYLQVPGCSSCPIPSMILVASADNGVTWKGERRIANRGSAQFDAQIVVDPVDRRTVYAGWLERDRRDIVVARSVDFGLTWTEVVATRTETEADKPVLAVRGLDIYVAYNRAAKVWVAASHDGGNSFTPVNVNPTDGMGWAQAGGATIDPAGNLFLSWAGYTRAGGGQGPVDLYVSRSARAPLDEPASTPLRHLPAGRLTFPALKRRNGRLLHRMTSPVWTEMKNRAILPKARERSSIPTPRCDARSG